MLNENAVQSLLKWKETSTQWKRAMSRTTTLLLLIATMTAMPLAQADDADRLIRRANRYLAPLPEAMPGAENDTPERIALGKQLFFDTRLSINDAQSCATCHRLEGGAAGMDNLPTSPGAQGQLGTRNTPTVINAGWQFKQFWDGRAENLADQAGKPILNPIEMAMPNEEAVVEKLQGIPEYPASFAEAFPGTDEPLTYSNMTEAIAAFERTLRSESRFDDFLRGDKTALSEQEQSGLSTFIKVNCVRCHDGPVLGGGLFERLGKYGSYPDQKDTGRHQVTKEEGDRFVFKVPQLRNIARTAPYFHDGAVADLGEAVRIMGKIQLDVELSDKEVEDLVAFLKTLDGKESPEL